jgi:pimeloyl-ACP methyl ester carboxylesterase
MPYCTMSDGVRLYYEDFGDGPPIVFTNCGVQTHKMWENQVAGLTDRFRVITYDWRGTGDSDKPRSGYTAASAGSDLVKLVETLDIAPATLVGHGIGAQVVLLAATSRPSTISHRPPHPAVGHAVLEQALAWPQYVSNAYVKDFTKLDSRERLKMINWPTLLIQGRHDRKQRYEGAMYLESHIKGARLHTLEESAHMGQVEEINQFNAAVANFVNERMNDRQAA